MFKFMYHVSGGGGGSSINRLSPSSRCSVLCHHHCLCILILFFIFIIFVQSWTLYPFVQSFDPYPQLCVCSIGVQHDKFWLRWRLCWIHCNWRRHTYNHSSYLKKLTCTTLDQGGQDHWSETLDILLELWWKQTIPREYRRYCNPHRIPLCVATEQRTAERAESYLVFPGLWGVISSFPRAVELKIFWVILGCGANLLQPDLELSFELDPWTVLAGKKLTAKIQQTLGH